MDDDPDKLFDKAKAKYNSWSLFNPNKYEHAAEMFERVANKYRLIGSWEKAADSFMRAVDCDKKRNSLFDTCKHMNYAAECFMKANKYVEAILYLGEAAYLYAGEGYTIQSARNYLRMAEIYESIKEYINSIKFYEMAITYYEMDRYHSYDIERCMEKIGNIMIVLEDYSGAVRIYEKIIVDKARSSITPYGIKTYIVTALLCHMIYNYNNIENILDKYCATSVHFHNESEYGFIRSLISAVDNADTNRFDQVVNDYTLISSLDRNKITLIKKIRDGLATTINDDVL